MDIQIDAKSRQPIAEQIKDKLVRLIEKGDIGPGEELPSVHELADILQISRMTTAGVYESLCSTGIIEKTEASGHYRVSRRKK